MAFGNTTLGRTDERAARGNFFLQSSELAHATKKPRDYAGLVSLFC
jgi:hypothetical protein